MNKVLAILMEPAQYTLDRNSAIYDPMGIDYIYLRGESVASDVQVSAAVRLKKGILSRFRSARSYLRNYDTVIINGYNSLEFILFWMLNLWYKKVIAIESDTPLRIPQTCLKRLLKFLYLHLIFSPKWIYGLAGGSVSHVQLFSHYGMPANRIYLMPMVIDTNKFIKLEKDHDKNSSPIFRFLYVGRLVECKDLPVLLQAFSALNKKHNDTELILVGNGELESLLKGQWNHYKGITFAGVQYGECLLDFYRKSDCLILPSKSEPWGLVVNEALAAGLPVIVSDSVGARWDLVETPNTGIVFPTGNAEELGKAMEKMISNSDFYRSCSKNAADLMHNHWNFTFYKKCLEEFLHETGKSQ